MSKKFRYVLEAIAIYLAFFIFSRLSIDVSSNILGKLARYIGPKLRVSKTAYNNLKRIFPSYSEIEIQNIITEMWENLGRVAGEFPHIYKLTDEEFLERVKVNGLENIEYIKNSTVPSIFFSAHMANWEVSPRILAANNIQTALVYRTANNGYVDKIINKERARSNIKIIPKGVEGAKLLLENIKKNVTIAMLVDQKMNDGIEVPFFGLKAMTAPAIARLALKYGCPIIPAQVIREKGCYFTVNIYPPLVINPHESIVEVMEKINKTMEHWIKQHIPQWFWVHKRWSSVG